MSSGMPYRRGMGAMRARRLAASMAFGAVLAWSAQAFAQDRAHGSSANGRFSIEETNDKFGLGDTDAQYTQGLKVRGTWDPRWQSSWMSSLLYEPYRRRLRPRRITGSFEIGQDIFTPDDISPFDEEDERMAAGLDPLTPEQKQAEFDDWYEDEFRQDRPYSSELYGEFKISGYFTRPLPIIGWKSPGMWRWSVAGRLGYVGPTGGGEVQKAVHVLMRGLSGEKKPRDPQGWEFQQGENGFDPIRNTEIDRLYGGNASAELEVDVLNRDWGWGQARISGLVFTEVGMFRDLGGLGGRGEIGYLGKKPLACFPTGQHSEIPPACSNEDGPAAGGDVSTFALYIYAQARGRATAFNRHLDNRFWRDDHVEANRRPTEADLTAGIVGRFWTFELELAQTAYTRVTRHDERTDLGHYVGTIKVSALF